MTRQVGGDDIGVNTEAGGKATEAHPRQLFDQHQGDLGGGARATVGFVHIRAQQAGGTQCAPQLPRHHVLFFPTVHSGG